MVAQQLSFLELEALIAAIEIRGLTLHQPWAGLVAAGIKLIENRKWAPPARLLDGTLLAIHAGLAWDEEGAEYIREAMGMRGHDPWPPEWRVFDRGILAVARVTGHVRVGEADKLSEDQRRWLFGPYGWTLDKVQQIEVVPCRGMQGLWPLPADVRAAVLAQVAA